MTMNMPAIEFARLAPGLDLGRLSLTISAAANERYWQAAGLDHPALRAGVLYPPIATNLTVLLFGATCPDPVIQTGQRLRCHRRALAGTELITTGRVTDRYEKRGREYVDVHTEITTADAPSLALWSSDVSFTPAATLGTPA
jgi:hypothetical protein